MDVSDYILKNIAMLDRNTIDVNNLTNELCIKICEETGLTRSTQMENMVSDILTKYKNKEFSSTEVVDYINKIFAFSVSNDTNTTNNLNNTNQNLNIKASNSTNTTVISNSNQTIVKTVNNPKQNNPTKKISTVNKSTITSQNQSSSIVNNVDIDTEIVINTSNKLSGVASEVVGASVNIPGAVASYASGIQAAVNASKSQIEGALEKCKEAMMDAISTVASIDDEITPAYVEGMSFADINKYAYDVKKNREATRVTEEFFRNGGCTIEGNFAILKVDGHECKFDMKKREFYVDGKKAFNADFYVPAGTTNYKELNTFTFFVENIDKSRDVIEKRAINNVAIKIIKPGGGAEYTKYEETALVTKFVNRIAKTDLSRCQNVIGGDSVYGAHSLKIAAKTGDLYQTVYCVNNAVIVPGENGAGANKTQITRAELSNLNGKDIYFISVSGDPNLDHNKKGGWDKKSSVPYDVGYVYTGLNIICDACPDAKIHMIYNAEVSGHDKLKDLLENLENTYSNYSYEPDKWYAFARSSYKNHSEGPILINDLAESPITNYNDY